ncbi:Platelet-activating factor acetylhydrolase IB subunit beta like [Dissostichus eleginoides]|uniref:Platelet-activating factor acetylhydrolase IB subunit beta like n=1 Tax=Dissostichus eleginoides TaxID=100907 RepID=A0AAD9F7I7_DISEL|nr:Platelet-activating factor acetylhydrolase IB subunit beta like [Dissostichus eleginoides]
MQVGLLIGHEGPLLDSFPLEVFNVAVVVEEKIILHDLRDVLAGFAVLMGAIYCLNLEYPRTQKYTAEISPLNNGLCHSSWKKGVSVLDCCSTHCSCFQQCTLYHEERAQQEKSAPTDNNHTLPETETTPTSGCPAADPEEKEPTGPEPAQDPQLDRAITDLKVKFTELERELVQLRELISQQPAQDTRVQQDLSTPRSPPITQMNTTPSPQTNTTPHPSRPAQQRGKPDIVILIDSNGKFIDENKLFPTHTVAKIWCPNTQHAMDLLSEQQLGSPSHIIIHTGSNDLRSQQERVSESLRGVIEKASTTFPNSRVVMSTLLPRKDLHPDTIHRINSNMSRDCILRPNVHLAHHPTLDINCLYDHVHLYKNTVPIFARTLKDVALNRDQSTPQKEQPGPKPP